MIRTRPGPATNRPRAKREHGPNDPERARDRPRTDPGRTTNAAKWSRAHPEPTTNRPRTNHERAQNDPGAPRIGREKTPGEPRTRAETAANAPVVLVLGEVETYAGLAGDNEPKFVTPSFVKAVWLEDGQSQPSGFAAGASIGPPRTSTCKSTI